MKDTVTNAELLAALQSCMGRSRRIARLRRRPCDYRSSFALEELRLSFDDGSDMAVIFKSLGPEAVLKRARLAKPAFVRNPLREISVYRKILQSSRLETARCYGTSVNARSGRYWLFLERIPGTRLSEEGAFDVWQAAARWAAVMHKRLANAAEGQAAREHLLVYDAAFYRTWLERARRETAGCSSAARRTLIGWLDRYYGRVIDRMLALPRTVVHGDFYASNILTARGPSRLRVCPIDWEMAARAPGLIDLAALIAGNWSEKDKARLAAEYHAALEPAEPPPAPFDALMSALDCCRLHLAVQWMGWSEQWSPPPEHAYDWEQEALTIIQRLSL